MTEKIKICTGPGCRAWGAELVARRVKKLEEVGEVVLVSCMDKCGGGVSIRLKDRGKIFKLREMEEVAKLVNRKPTVKGKPVNLTVAC